MTMSHDELHTTCYAKEKYTVENSNPMFILWVNSCPNSPIKKVEKCLQTFLCLYVDLEQLFVARE